MRKILTFVPFLIRWPELTKQGLQISRRDHFTETETIQSLGETETENDLLSKP